MGVMSKSYLTSLALFMDIGDIMLNCAQCGKPIEKDATTVDLHASVATKNFKFHPTEECAGEFEHTQAVRLGLLTKPESEE